MALANSRTTVLLARRNSRSTLPAVRIASGSFSGGMTMTATKRSRRISKMTRPSANYRWRANPIEPRPTVYNDHRRSPRCQTMNKTALIADRRYLKHFAGRHHPERPERVAALIEAAESLPREKLKVYAPRAATPEELALCHRPEYIEAVERTAAIEPLRFRSRYACVPRHLDDHGAGGGRCSNGGRSGPRWRGRQRLRDCPATRPSCTAGPRDGLLLLQ